MKGQQAPRSIRQQMLIQQIGTETLVYDERRHMAFCLNESSSAIWGLADGERTVAEIGAASSLLLKAPVSEELVLFAIEELRRDGLMEPCLDAECATAVSRRTMLQRLGVGGAMLLPVVAAIMAPTAAQAYSGCFDCDVEGPVQAAQAARATQLARARRQQLSGQTQLAPLPSDLNGGMFSPYPEPKIGDPYSIDPK